MKKFKNHTLQSYLDVLAKKEPVPGGGSVSAYTAAMAVGLISMVAGYSLGKGKAKAIETRINKILSESKKIRERLLELTDLDAAGYLGIVRSRGKSKVEQNKAKRQAAKVPKEVCRLSYKAIRLIPYLVKNGNQYLVSDLEVAAELLLAAHYGAAVLCRTNNS